MEIDQSKQTQGVKAEPQITKERQEELAKLLSIKPDPDRGIYPFEDVELNRADVEWLLKTKQRTSSIKTSLVLKGSVLCMANLSRIDLSKFNLAEADLTGADLTETKLLMANLSGADLSGADLSGANLQGAKLFMADLARAKLFKADLTGADLTETKLFKADLTGADLSGADLQGAKLFEATLSEATLSEATLSRADLQGANLFEATLSRADLQGANLSKAKLFKANLSEAKLSKANLSEAVLSGVKLYVADLSEANFTEADLSNADLSRANLRDSILFMTRFCNEQKIGPKIIDASMEGVRLTLIEDLDSLEKLYDEEYVNYKRSQEEISPPKLSEEYRRATRAYRQFCVALREQGLNEIANRLTYRQNITQRKSYWFAFVAAKKLKEKVSFLFQWLFSWFLFLLCGYGYKLSRALIAYLGLILFFAAIYGFGIEFLSANNLLQAADASWWQHLDLRQKVIEAVVGSINAFHGRSVSTELSQLIGQHSWLLLASGAEAVVGLIIEATLIATLTQRFFGK